jgi:hypothetical protein
MTHVTEALQLMLKLAKMSIPELIQAREATDNPKFHSILDKVIDSKLPKNNP